MRSGNIILAFVACAALPPRPAAGQESPARSLSADTELKKEAIFLLANRRSPESSQALRSFYARTDDDELKKSVLFHLAQTGSAENLRFLKTTALDAGTPDEIRKTAIFWLAQNSETDMAELQELYDHAENRGIKEQIIFAYSQRHEVAAVDQLMTLARQEPDIELRKKALFWLGQSHDARVTSFLTDLVSQ